jgi:flagellar biosynthesis chaperone FliJ
VTPSEILSLSDERDQWLRRLDNAWRAGMAHGEAIHAQDYDNGYAAAIADVKRTEQALYRVLRSARVRWVVRGQERTRLTFAQPHPRDYKP